MKRIILAIVVSLFLVIPAFGANVILAWDENIETDLDGYQVWQSSTAGGLYDLVVEIPPNHHETDSTLPNNEDRDSYRVLDLADGIYYWVLTAFDNEVPRNVSGYSNEVHIQVINDIPVPIPPAPPTGLTAEQE